MQAEVRYVRLTQRLGRAALGVALASIGGGVALVPIMSHLRGPELLAPIAIGGVIGYLGAALLWMAGIAASVARPFGRTTTSVCDGSLLVIGARRRYELPHEELVRGAIVRGGVSIEDARGRELRLPMTRAAARRLLDELGIGAGNRRYEWRTPGTRGALGVVLGLVGWGAIDHWVADDGGRPWMGAIFAGSVVLGILGEWLVWRWGSTRVVVGFDGVHVQTGRDEQTIRFADVARVDEDDVAAQLGVILGRDETWNPPWKRLDPAMAEAVRTRVAHAYQQAREHRVAPELPERSADAGAYRTAEVRQERTRDALRGVLDSPLTADETRLEAARALAADADERAHIALVAEAVASPTLRRRLLAIARPSRQSNA